MDFIDIYKGFIKDYKKWQQPLYDWFLNYLDLSEEDKVKLNESLKEKIKQSDVFILSPELMIEYAVLSLGRYLGIVRKLLLLFNNKKYKASLVTSPSNVFCTIFYETFELLVHKVKKNLSVTAILLSNGDWFIVNGFGRRFKRLVNFSHGKRTERFLKKLFKEFAGWLAYQPNQVLLLKDCKVYFKNARTEIILERL